MVQNTFQLTRFCSSLFQIQDPSRAHKRLRLAVKKTNTGTSIATYASLLETVTNSNEALQILIHISDALQYTNEEDMQESMQKISEHFRREQESAVRVKILALFSEFSQESCAIENAVLVDEIINLLGVEKSPKVISQGLHSLFKIGEQQPLANAVLIKMVNFARNQLKSQSHNVQRHALLLLGAFSALKDAENETLDLIGKYTDSQDSRVRAQAFRSILTLGRRDVFLTPTLYPRAIESLKDDYECVRREALQLVYELGIKHPEQ